MGGRMYRAGDTTKNAARAAQARVFDKMCPKCKTAKRVNLDDKEQSEYYLRQQTGITGKRNGSPVRPDTYCKKCRRERNRTNDAKAAQRKREWAKKNAKRKAEQRKASRLRVQERTNPTLDAEPFARWWQEFYRSHRHIVDPDNPRFPMYRANSVAQACGLSAVEETLLGEFARGARWYEEVKFLFVDKVTTHCGEWYVLTQLYPLEQEEHEEGEEDRLAA